MSDEEKPQTTREIMDKIYAMTPEEFNDFMHWNFLRTINSPARGASSSGGSSHDPANNSEG